MRDKAKALFSETLYRNSLYLMLATGTMAVLGFAFWLVVAHLYPPQQVGVASTLISAMNFIANLSLLGLNSTLIRFLPTAKNRNEQIDTSLMLVALAGGVSSLIFAVASPYFAPKLGLLHQPLFGFGFVVLCISAAVNLITDSIFIAYRSSGYNLFVDGLLGSGTQLLLPVALVALGAYGIFAGQGIAAVVAMGFSIYFLVKKFKYVPRPKLERSVLRHLRYYSLRSYSAGLLNIAPTIILPIIILNRLGAAAAGYYYLAYMMANTLFAVAYAVAQALFAEGSYGDKQLRGLLKRSAIFLGALMIPASAAMALVGPYVLEVFGHTYGTHGREVIIVLASAGPFMAAYSLGAAILNIAKQMRALILINLLDAVVVCTLALVWVHRGLAWVAGAWVVGHAAAALLTFVILGVQYWRQRAASAHRPA